ncbi:MAG: winged helix DNA-binding domain-containing protein [Acidimicrobiales bacterium]
MTAEILSDRALNRATLQRQLLLERAPMPVLDAVEHLVGLQAQEPNDPYLALWSRLDGFRPDDLAHLLVDRKVVRIVVMRGTIHLLTADDCLMLRPLMQPVLDAEIKRHRDYAPLLDGVDLGPVLAFVRSLVADNPLSGRQLRAALAERFPEHHAAALAYAARCHLPMVQVPPRGVWGRSAQVSTTTAESWLGRPLASAPSIDAVVMRYLAAFGPATVADVASWCRLTGLREVVERLRPRLQTFRDERGRELFDVPDSPRADPDVAVPTRFLPEYDNVLLSHADRSRFLVKNEAERLYSLGERAVGAVLHDGLLRATWRLERDRSSGSAAMVVGYLGCLPDGAGEAIEAEGRRLLGLVAADAAESDLRFVALS